MDALEILALIKAVQGGGGGLPASTKYGKSLAMEIDSATFVVTAQLKDQNGDNLGTAQTIDLPLESVVVGGSYNDSTKKVVLTLQNGNTVEFSVADLVAGLQSQLSAANKLDPAFIDYDSTHRAVSDTEKTAWNGKQSALSSAQLSAVNSGIDSTKVGQISANKAEIADIIDNGAKNLFDMTASSGTIAGNGITVTVNADKSLTLNGTSQNSGVTNFHLGKVSVPAGNYVLSGCVGGSNSTYFLRIIADPSVTNTNGSIIFETDGFDDVYVDIVIGGNKTLDDVTFKPMICTKTAWDISQKYVSYCPPVNELYRMLLASS